MKVLQSFSGKKHLRKMAKKILQCPKCSTYTMKDKCPNCGTSTVQPKPAKWSPEDKYGDLRRKAKKEILIEKKAV
jgi:H/ACA ribonucleoprotein complex subunit 3